MTGILYGIGTGPGDPELMTLKAVRITRECDVIALPVSNRTLITSPVLKEAGMCEKKILDSCVAYRIALPNVPELKEKPFLLCPMPMSKDKEELDKVHDADAQAVAELLKQEKKVGFLTLGDPTVYSTYLYLDKRVRTMGCRAEIISGIPSFCASAARLGIGLVENKQALHVIPTSYGVEEGLQFSGTTVLMKAGKKIGEVKEAVLDENKEFYMVENCGMDTECVYTKIEDVPQEASYYSLMILKEDV